MHKRALKLFCVVAVPAITLFASLMSQAANTASDNAGNSAYSGGWTNGSNGGTGLGDWDLGTSIANPGNDGFFIGSSTNNGTGSSGSIDTANNSWGAYANGNNGVANALSVGYRPFTGGALGVGQTVVIKIDNGYIDGGGMVGIAFMNADPVAANALSSVLPNTNTRFDFLFVGGTNQYQIVVGDGVGSFTNLDTGIAFTDGGLTIAFTLTGTDNYSLSINGGTAITGTLGGSAGQMLNGIAVFNYIAGTGGAKDAFFNSLAVLEPTPSSVANLAVDAAADAGYASGWTNNSAGGYGWGSSWVFTPGMTGSSGQFIGTSQVNGSQDGNIDVLDRSWGLFANGGGSITARRDFSQVLQTGQSFVIDMDNGYIDNNSFVGFLLTGNGDPGASSQFEFSFKGGDTNYTITTGKLIFTASTNTGVGFTSKGLHIVLTLDNAGAYNCAITPNGGATTNFTGTGLAGSDGLGHLELFNNNAGNGTDHDAFFNNIAIVPAPAMTGIIVTGETNAVVSFLPSRVLRHDLQTCTDLIPGAWSTVASNLTGSGNTAIQVPDSFPATDTKRFYRVKSSP